MSSVIYKITNKSTNKKYIGWTKRKIEARWKTHIQCAKRGIQTHLYNAIRLYGQENFIIEEIEKGENDEYMLNIREPFWISQYNIEELYNMTLGGEGGKNSKSWKNGNVPWSKGKKLQYVSENMKNRWSKWREENPDYKSKWKKYDKKGFSTEEKQKRKHRAIEKNKTIINCPHCSKTGNIGNMKRWHFDNCKMKNNG
jgi:group I intron endonuclease